ncbi:oligopeptide transport system permease protein [Caldicoprobacter guelmensis]|uniref:ABC transporter permease n=1 Tax=Caldicoprobacter guelmensis TaxID=1170224 RepID=UPI001959CCF6|nr:ABC transporter permease [Caldicoprobacter guelmensis]MBM7582745.1 oligopeptide transport system permease protein [Caldicoprobacter guelmensis]
MGRYIIHRLISMALTLFFIITITFLLMHAIPGGPFTREKPLPEAIIKALNEKYHLDDPIWKQYLDYWKDILRGDLGPSFQLANYTVNDLIARGFPITAKLGIVSIIFTVLIGVPMGVISALRQGKWEDYTTMFIATLGVTIPSFVLATILIYLFGVVFKIFPVSSGSLTKPIQYVLPVIALSGYSLSFIARLMRSSMLDVIRQDYIRTARAKGLSELKVIYKHALKNAIIPVITYLGPLAAGLLTGSFVIERLFSIPGMGEYFVKSVGNRDYTMIMGSTIFYSVILVVMNFIVDIIYVIIDPRIKLTSTKEG